MSCCGCLPFGTGSSSSKVRPLRRAEVARREDDENVSEPPGERIQPSSQEHINGGLVVGNDASNSNNSSGPDEISSPDGTQGGGANAKEDQPARPSSNRASAREPVTTKVPQHLFMMQNFRRSRTGSLSSEGSKSDQDPSTSCRAQTAEPRLGSSAPKDPISISGGIRPMTTGGARKDSFDLGLPALSNSGLLATQPLEQRPRAADATSLLMKSTSLASCDGFSPPPLSETILRHPSLYIGSFECLTAQYMTEAMIETGVKNVVCLGMDLAMIAVAMKEWPEMKFHHQAFPDPTTISGAKNLWPYYQSALDMIHLIYGPGRSIMICCPNGMDIAPSVTIALLMELHTAQPERGKMRLKMAFSLVKGRHPIMNLSAKTRVLLRSREYVLYKGLTLKEEQMITLNAKYNNDLLRERKKAKKAKQKKLKGATETQNGKSIEELKGRRMEVMPSVEEERA